jgi:hypothetical protein
LAEQALADFHQGRARELWGSSRASPTSGGHILRDGRKRAFLRMRSGVGGVRSGPTFREALRQVSSTPATNPCGSPQNARSRRK